MCNDAKISEVLLVVVFHTVSYHTLKLAFKQAKEKAPHGISMGAYLLFDFTDSA
jgi:hypothetical protein